MPPIPSNTSPDTVPKQPPTNPTANVGTTKDLVSQHRARMAARDAREADEFEANVDKWIQYHMDHSDSHDDFTWDEGPLLDMDMNPMDGVYPSINPHVMLDQQAKKAQQ